jgi:hypothetical protein
VRYALAQEEPIEDLDSDDIRPVKIRLAANLLDLILRARHVITWALNHPTGPTGRTGQSTVSSSESWERKGDPTERVPGERGY